eukprot:scaffold14.g1208.t1
MAATQQQGQQAVGHQAAVQQPAEQRLPVQQTQSQPQSDCGCDCVQGRRSPLHILFDVMDCVVADPFYTHMAAFFELEHEEFLLLKDPGAWIEFENGLIEEDEFCAKLFTDRRAVDGAALRAHMERHYRYVHGMDALLERLSAAGHSLHAFTNYTRRVAAGLLAGIWYHMIDRKLGLGRFLHWTFVLGCPADRLLFIDDRLTNVEAARQAGMQAIHFTGSAAQLEQELPPAAVRKQPADLGGSSASGLQQQKQQQLPWRERFKQRFVEARREERLLRAARMQRHEGAVHLLQAERHRLRQALRGEQATLVHLRGELAALRQATQQAAQQARRAELAQTYWQPVAVARAAGVVTTQAPLDVAAREADLDQRIAVAALEVRKLSASLAATEKRLCDAQRKLRQLRP